MSTQGPQFDDLLTHFLAGLGSLKHDLGLLKNHSLTTNAQKVLDEISHSYTMLAKIKVIPEEELESVTVQAAEKIDRIAKELVGKIIQSNPDIAALFQRDVNRFKDHIFSFKPILRAKEMVNRVGLDALLDQSWAKAEWQELVLIQNPWAIDKLEALLQAEQEEAFTLLVKFIAINPGSEFSEPYLKHPKLILTIQKMLGGSAPDQSAALRAIGILLQAEDFPWAFEELEKKAKENNVEAMSILEGLLQKCRYTNKKLYQYMVSRLKEGNHRVIEVVFNYLCWNQTNDPFIKYLMKKTYQDTDLQFIMIAYATLPREWEFGKMVRETINQFIDPFKKPLEYKIKLLDRMTDLHNQFRNQPYKRTDITSLLWAPLSITQRVHVLRLLIQREHDLINVLVNNSSLSKDAGPPCSQYFPKVSHVLAGYFFDDTRVDFRRMLYQFAQELAGYSVPLVMFVPPYLSFPDDLHLQCLPSLQPPKIWVQDACHIQAKGITYPAPFAYDDKIVDKAIEMGYRRVNSAPQFTDEVTQEPSRPFSSIQGAAVLQGYHPLVLCIAQMQEGLLQKIHTTCVEGGNCLFGSDHEGPYAVVGKDALFMSQLFLSKELALIGLKKNEDGEWLLTEPYIDTGDNISIEDTKKLIAHDLGLSVNRVYFVEQSEFHLDTVMMLGEGKTMFLNDSQMVLELLEKYEESIKEKTWYIENAKEYPKRKENYQNELSKLISYEIAAQSDLIKQGFKVVPVGGVITNIFKPHQTCHRINCFNTISITAQDKKVIFAMDMEPFFKEHFLALVRQHMGADIEIHFLDQKGSQALLVNSGGIRCMTKLLSTFN